MFQYTDPVFEHYYTKQSNTGIKIEAYKLAIPCVVSDEEKRATIVATCYENLINLYNELTEDKVVNNLEKNNFITSVIFSINNILIGKAEICEHLEQELIVLTRAKDDIKTAALIVVALLTDDNKQIYQFTSDVQLYEKSIHKHQIKDPFSDMI